MTAAALDIANRSIAFLGTFIDALNKAVAMAKAVRHDSPSASDIKKVHAIAETL